MSRINVHVQLKTPDLHIGKTLNLFTHFFNKCICYSVESDMFTLCEKTPNPCSKLQVSLPHAKGGWEGEMSISASDFSKV